MIRKKHIMSRYLMIIVLVVLIISFVIYKYNEQNKSSQEACINRHCFKLEIAKTQEEKVKGLMYRSSLKEDLGMLFIFESEDIYSFWMKNTLIPLDIIWINKDNKIIYIEHNAPPCKTDPCPVYSPKEKSSYVIEINANLAEKYGIKKGDEVQITVK